MDNDLTLLHNGSLDSISLDNTIIKLEGSVNK